MMKLITMAKITLNRPGSIGRGGFQRSVSHSIDSRRTFNVVLNGDAPGDVLEKVKELAIDNGESADGVERLTVSTPHSALDGLIHFKERFEPYATGTQFGSDYAE